MARFLLRLRVKQFRHEGENMATGRLGNLVLVLWPIVATNGSALANDLVRDNRVLPAKVPTRYRLRGEDEHKIVVVPTHQNLLVQLRELAPLFGQLSLEAVLVGSGATALWGNAHKPTDLDFMYRKTPKNDQKLRQLAAALGGSIGMPYDDVASSLQRIVRPNAMPLEFMDRMHGFRGRDRREKDYGSLKSRAFQVDLGGGIEILVADLGDIIKSKRLAGRNKDLQQVPGLEQLLEERGELTKGR